MLSKESLSFIPASEKRSIFLIIFINLLSAKISKI